MLYHSSHPAIAALIRAVPLIAAVLVFPGMAHAATRYVAVTGSDNNPGTAAKPFHTIQKGITASSNGDTVVIGDGTYTGNGNVDLVFGGRNLSLTSQNGPTKTAISCGGVSSAGGPGGFEIAAGEIETLTGITVKNGYQSYGGGIYNSGSVTLMRCNFTANSASEGGGFANVAGQATLTDCVFLSNTSAGGAGFYNDYSSTATLTGCTFTQNTNANSSGGGFGNSGTATLTNCIFTKNSASSEGGGLYNDDGAAVTLTSCTFTQNAVTFGFGGGLALQGGTAALTGCTFTGNTASSSGGGLYNYSGVIGLVGCIFTGNTTGGSGGGVFNERTQSKAIAPRSADGEGPRFSSLNTGVLNCTFANNSAQNGGGFYNNTDPAVIANCTFVGNTATGDGGGGIYNDDDSQTLTVTGCTFTQNSGDAFYNFITSGDSANLTNDILYGNSGGELFDVGGSSSDYSLNYCDIQGGIDGISNTNIDPKFVNAAAGDVHLTANSPCHGKGTVSAPAYVTTDKDGLKRPIPPAQGAYEGTGGTPVNPVGTTHILWANTNGIAALWNYTAAAGTYSAFNFGPYPGWTAKAIADGGTDGKTRLLWNNTNGTAALWNVTSSTEAFTSTNFGPYSGWTAKAVSVAKDNTAHILWTNTNGKAALWNVVGGAYQTEHDFGPYSGWTAKAVADAPDGSTRLLWTNTNGTAAFWNVNPSTGAFSQFSFGPYSGWTAKAISVSSATTHILWSNTNGSQAVWNYTPSSGIFTQKRYGPYSGWIANGLADGSDGKTHLLWNNVNGTASFWSLDNATGLFGAFSFGPYSGWSAIAISAGS